MNTLKVETEITKTMQATEAVEIVDCGRVSERTHGLIFLFFFEAGVPPQNTFLF
jgi:hypothetical protein